VQAAAAAAARPMFQVARAAAAVPVAAPVMLGAPVARGSPVALGVVQTVGRGSRRARGATVACERSLGDHWRRSSGSARRDRRRHRGSSAGELWRGLAPRSSYKTSKVFKSHGPATRLAERRATRLCNTLDSQVKKILVSWTT
jgi:hypothetical protein